jgi:hypothetical protein
MSRLVTGLFYERSDAERAVEALKAAGFGSENIYLETEVTPTGEMGHKGGEISSLETERRFAGLETGVVIGFTVGLLSGLGMGFLGNGINEFMRSAGADNASAGMPAILTNPAMTTLLGALIGLVAGGLIGWVVDNTLNRLGAGPPLPQHETLVTVRTDEDKLDQVYATLFKSRARHLHVAEASMP